MKYEYFNRDISWLSFNYRVLQEAFDDSLPLYERIKFLAIFSNNLEEFYRVRVSYYRGLLRTLSPEHPKIKEVDPAGILLQINKIVSKQQGEFHKLFDQNIVPELRKEGIYLYQDEDEITEAQDAKLKNIFRNDILTSIQPVLLVKNRVKPFLKTGHVYLAMELFTKNKMKNGSRAQYGLIKLPTDHGISRFIDLGEHNGKHFIMFLEDLIMRYVHKILPGYVVNNWYSIKVTRDADLEYEEYDGDDLIEIIENISHTRAIGEPNRFQFDSSMPTKLLNFLTETFDIDEHNRVKGGRHHNFRDFFTFPNPLSPALEIRKLVPIRVPAFENSASILKVIEKKDIMLHFPFQPFDYFLQFLQEAAVDSDVESIQLTQYRVASNSAVVDALIGAALNGKAVSVFVELKARFDEENNLQYSRLMKQAGIRIGYSAPHLKVHAKMALVTKKAESAKKARRYAFLGTGNFNEKTAALYGDHGFFTSSDEICTEAMHLFRLLEDLTYKYDFQHLLIPNINMIETFTKYIDQEIKYAKKGKKAYILLKMNGLEDPFMIDKLYEASEAGVKIDLIVRGVCRVIPKKKYSKNIKIIRIVDRFLEHARVFVFLNKGDHVIFLSSADWMRRNLYKRIECGFPIYDQQIKEELLDILNLQLADNVKGRLVNEKLENEKPKMSGVPIRSQMATYDYLKGKYEE
jgi:polyphosphate kinase